LHASLRLQPRRQRVPTARVLARERAADSQPVAADVVAVAEAVALAEAVKEYVGPHYSRRELD
jgi:hypothetical protein